MLYNCKTIVWWKEIPTRYRALNRILLSVANGRTLLGLNLPADLGPVLVMLFTKSNEHNFPFNFQVIFRPKTSTRNRRFERSKRCLKNAAAVTRKRFERRFRSRQKTSRTQFSRVNVSRPLTGLKTTGTNIIKLFCCK